MLSFHKERNYKYFECFQEGKLWKTPEINKNDYSLDYHLFLKSPTGSKLEEIKLHLSSTKTLFFFALFTILKGNLFWKNKLIINYMKITWYMFSVYLLKILKI